MSAEPEPNLAWSWAIVDELARAGVRHVCVSPGARSAPLALAAADHPAVATSVHIDERSAAFFALGYGRATGVPAVLVCTSGTAAANYLPAVIEAHYGAVPLVVLTADRPPELRDTGAWQAIDQIKLFGGYVRWFAEVATPSDVAFMRRTVRSLAARAVATACGRPPGPVHLNLPFREPLVSEESGELAAGEPTEGLVAAGGGRADGASFTVVPASEVMAPMEVLDELAARVSAEPRGLILAGPIDAPVGYATAVARLAEAAGYPVLAEPAGGLRFGAHDRSHVVTGYDAFLRAEVWADAHPPGLVLRFGQSLTWKYVSRFLERHPGAVQVVVDPNRTWDDPTRLAAWRLAVDPVPLCEALADRLAGDRPVGDAGRGASSEAWRAAWDRASAVAGRALERAASEVPAGVAWVYAELMERLPDGALVHAANSMPVRDLDTFTRPAQTAVRALVNRGAAGIDGTVSSALGAALGSGAPTVLVTGDLAFLHDLNGLSAAAVPGVNATILVLDDGGGGIFEYLPVARRERETFERLFATPTGASLAAACAVYGVRHEVATDRAALGAAIEVALARPGVQVIEVPVDRAANTAAHRAYWAEVARELAGG